MNFKMPEANKGNLDKLLKYLGERAEHFKKCFDTESEWCWKYAAIVIRGLGLRETKYTESHHIIPVAYYASTTGKKITHRFAAKYTIGNLTGLDCSEHIAAHYCMAKCAKADMGIHADAFMMLYNVFRSSYRMRETAAASLFSDDEVFEILSMCPRVSRVSAEGRTHNWENPKKAKEEWRTINIERIHAYDRYRNKNTRKAYMKKYLASYWKRNKKHLQEYKKEWNQANAPHVKIYQHDYYMNDRSRLNEGNKSRYAQKVAAGFRRRKDPETGKTHWVLVYPPTAA